MRQATLEQRTAPGGFDLTTPAGLDRAADAAIENGDRKFFNEVMALRSKLAGRATPRAGSPLAAELARISAKCRALAGAADSVRIANTLAGGTGPRPGPRQITDEERGGYFDDRDRDFPFVALDD
jgi:hypothetical protein